MTLQPQILLANADKWLTESLESVLMQGGYTVIITAKRQHVLELARRHGPDGILLDMALDARVTDSLSLCRSLRSDPTISRATPIILTTAGPPRRARSRPRRAPRPAAAPSGPPAAPLPRRLARAPPPPPPRPPAPPGPPPSPPAPA